ncbi:MAG: hypothetical protein LH472_08560 [Pyrinomonadaceae bacterium]|nr:hypothetical protein [Pyrinomonadaceae bacterium]
MSFQNFYRTSCGTLSLIVFILTANAFAQRPTPTPRLVINQDVREMPIVGRNNLYCAGYVETGTVDVRNEIVGAEKEQEKYIYAQNDYVFISMGANRGVKVGDLMAVIRPRGKVSTKWTDKKNLGFYVQEIGAVEVVNVKSETSVARVISSCDNLLLGDLVQPIPTRASPLFEKRPALNLFSDSTGKTNGRIFMARDGQELLGREQIVYIDLGAEDNVKTGDYLTIYRPLGSGNILDDLPAESVAAKVEGFQSREYRGGKFSNQAGRKSGEKADGRVVTTKRAKRDRQENLRNVVGELVILNVKERTATAVIVRTTQEIHTGDRVELQ